MADVTDPFRAAARLAKTAALKTEVVSAWWGTVASVSGAEVTVVLDGDDLLQVQPVTANAGGPCLVGDEVLLQMQGRDLTIVANPTAQARAMATLGALPRIATGTASITPTAANTPTSVAVTFPAGRFTATPIVVAIPHTSAPGTQVTGVGISGRSASGCTIVGTRTNTTGFEVGWIAIQV